MADYREMFSTDDVCRMTGASFRRVDYWARQGLMVPEQEAAGSGTARRWSADDVRAVALLVALKGRLRDAFIAEHWQNIRHLIRQKPMPAAIDLDGIYLLPAVLLNAFDAAYPDAA